MMYPPRDGSQPVSMEQLADDIRRAHDCIHNVGERVDKLADVVAENRHASANRDQLLAIEFAEIKGALGIGRVVKGKRRKAGARLASMSKLEAAIAGLGVLGGAQLLYQWVAPSAWAFLVSLHHQIMSGG